MLNKKNIFLLDGIGAVISAVFTGFLLPHFYEWTGLPTELLHRLAIIPVVYALFSFGCYLLTKETKPWMLKVIMLANMIYCLITSILIVSYQGLTFAGQSLLFLEILVVICVVGIELRVYKNEFICKD